MIGGWEGREKVWEILMLRIYIADMFPRSSEINTMARERN